MSYDDNLFEIISGDNVFFVLISYLAELFLLVQKIETHSGR